MYGNEVMNNKYNYKTEDNLHIFTFESIGSKGTIKKIIQYSQITEDMYNLGFGDYNEQTGEIDDTIKSNNGDSIKVLSTVVSTLYDFTNLYPDRLVFATGSNEVRTRLYRMGISNNLEELKKDFYVFGLKPDENFEEFIVGEDYKGFLVKRK